MEQHEGAILWGERGRIAKLAVHRVSDLTEPGSLAFETARPVLSKLLKAATAERDIKSIAYQIKSARFIAQSMTFSLAG